MAIGWLTALKVIPWGDVIEATPGLVKGARKMFTRTAEQAAPPVVPEAPASSSELQDRVVHLEARLAQVVEQQRASAELIDTLAERNARVVGAIEILRVRTRMLLWVNAVLGVAVLAGLVTWGLR